MVCAFGQCTNLARSSTIPLMAANLPPIDLDKVEAKFRNAVLNAWTAATRRGGVVGGDVYNALWNGDWEKAIEVAARGGAIRIADEHAAVYVQQGQQTAANLQDIARVAVRFDVVNDRAVNYMQRERLRLIREFTDSQRMALRTVMEDGITRGIGPRDMAREFRASVGLTQSQVKSVSNFRTYLEQAQFGNRTALERALRDRRFDPSIQRALETGTPIDRARVARMTQRYRERYIKYRAEVIARTEGLRAANSGTVEAMQQAIDDPDVPITEQETWKTWIATKDERTRDSHSFLSGMKIMNNDVFHGLYGALRYPHDPQAPARETVMCRCTLAYTLTNKPASRTPPSAKKPPTKKPATRTKPPAKKPKAKPRARPKPTPKPKPSPARPPVVPPTPARTAPAAPPTVNRTAGERSWHNKSWDDAPDDLKRLVERTPALDIVTKTPGRNAYMKHTTRMIEMDELDDATRHGQGTWRHEFGHWVDSRAGTGGKFASDTSEFRDAIGTTRARLMKNGTVDADIDSTRYNTGRQSIDVAHELRDRPRAERKKIVDDAFAKAGLDRDEVEQFLRKDGMLGSPDGFNGQETDMILLRFARAYDDLDPQAIGDLLLHKGGATSALLEDAGGGLKRITKGGNWARQNTGVGQGWSDMTDAITEGRANSGWTHTSEYYAKDRAARGKEIVANITQVYGAGPMGEKLLKKFVPDLYRLTRQYMGLDD